MSKHGATHFLESMTKLYECMPTYFMYHLKEFISIVFTCKFQWPGSSMNITEIVIVSLNSSDTLHACKLTEYY